MAYDERFRRKAVEYKDSGHTFKQLKDAFGISSYAYYTWKKNKEDSGFYVLPVVGKRKRKGKIDPDELRRINEEEPDLFLHEIAERFNCSAVAVFNRFKELKITRKKRHLPIPKNAKKKEPNLSKR